MKSSAHKQQINQIRSVIWCLAHAFSPRICVNGSIDLEVSFNFASLILLTDSQLIYYSKTFVKRPLKNKQNKDLNDKW